MPPFQVSRPAWIQVDAAVNRVSWINIASPTSVEIVDNLTHSSQRVVVTNAQFPGLDAMTGRLFVPSIAERSTLIVVDTASAAITAVVLLDEGLATRAIVDARARKVYVLQGVRVAVVDADSLSVAYVELSEEAYDGVVDSGNGRLYVTTSSGLIVFAIDAASRAVTTIPIPATPKPNSVSAVIALNPVRNELLVLAGGGSALAIVDGATFKVRTIPVPGVANRAMAVDSSTGKAYIPNPPAHTLTIVDTSTASVVGVPVPAQPNRIAVDELTGKIYLGLLNPGGVLVWDPLESTCRHASLSIL